ncbi:MAG: methyltransferase domain-containing protein [Chloroflexi bacterium]|nr:methyltransferase domain-containing protein [Chloroflexota bacterium]
MEDLACDREKLFRTYRQFALINRLFSQWRRAYQKYLRPRMTESSRTYRLLDIGFGGGDIPRSLLSWAQADGHKLEVTAIDVDERALEFVCTLKGSGSGKGKIRFLHASPLDLVHSGERFDFLISNHLLHHMEEQELRSLLGDAETLASELVLFSDTERSPLALISFLLITASFFQRSFISQPSSSIPCSRPSG